MKYQLLEQLTSRVTSITLIQCYICLYIYIYGRCTYVNIVSIHIVWQWYNYGLIIHIKRPWHHLWMLLINILWILSVKVYTSLQQQRSTYQTPVPLCCQIWWAQLCAWCPLSRTSLNVLPTLVWANKFCSSQLPLHLLSIALWIVFF